MTEQRDYTMGEVGRLLEQLRSELDDMRVESRESRHRLSDQINVLIGPVDVHRLQIAALEKSAERQDREVKELRDRVDSVAMKAAAVSGGIGVIGFLSQWFWPWKGH